MARHLPGYLLSQHQSRPDHISLL